MYKKSIITLISASMFVLMAAGAAVAAPGGGPGGFAPGGGGGGGGGPHHHGGHHHGHGGWIVRELVHGAIAASRYSYNKQCRRLRWRCEEGSRKACRSYLRRCD